MLPAQQASAPPGREAQPLPPQEPQLAAQQTVSALLVTPSEHTCPPPPEPEPGSELPPPLFPPLPLQERPLREKPVGVFGVPVPTKPKVTESPDFKRVL